MYVNKVKSPNLVLGIVAIWNIDKEIMTCILSNSMTMTYWHMTPLPDLPVSCITIIDTIILHIHTYRTYDAY
jgi:hypothetical protein